MGFTALQLAMRRSHEATAQVLGHALDRARKPGQW
jgi:hypothetical protein